METVKRQSEIKLGTHGERYGNWMPSTILFLVGGLVVFSATLAALSFAVWGSFALGAILCVVAWVFACLLAWIAWIRGRYSHEGGGMMDRVHEAVLSHLGFNGEGTLLDVGCGSGALSIRAALTWPDARVVGIDRWPAAYRYSQEMCEENATREGVANRCAFLRGDARKLDFADSSFDAVISNYVYHNISGADKRALLKETLRVLRKGGVFALNDEMKPHMYGDMERFARELIEAGFEDARIVDTAAEVFGSRTRAALLMLGDSRLLVGRK